MEKFKDVFQINHDIDAGFLADSNYDMIIIIRSIYFSILVISLFKFICCVKFYISGYFIGFNLGSSPQIGKIFQISNCRGHFVKKFKFCYEIYF